MSGKAKVAAVVIRDGPVEEVDDEPVLAHQPDQGLLGEVLVVEARVDPPE
jgi:hypothetical protein